MGAKNRVGLKRDYFKIPLKWSENLVFGGFFGGFLDGFFLMCVNFTPVFRVSSSLLLKLYICVLMVPICLCLNS